MENKYLEEYDESLREEAYISAEVEAERNEAYRMIQKELEWKVDLAEKLIEIAKSNNIKIVPGDQIDKDKVGIYINGNKISINKL